MGEESCGNGLAGVLSGPLCEDRVKLLHLREGRGRGREEESTADDVDDEDDR